MTLRNKKIDLSEYVKPGLNIDQVQQAKVYFDQMADKNTGLINAQQVRQILQSFGQKAPENQLHYTFQVVLDKFGPDSMESQINFQQFLYLVTSSVTEKDSKIDMKRLFNLYDDDRNGYLTKEKLRHIADEYGIWVSDKELQLMIVAANDTNDGKVTQQQFYKIMTRQE